MIFATIEEFFEKVEACRRLSRQEEMEAAKQMQSGDDSARQRLMESYTPMIAGHLKRMEPNLRTLGHAVYCMQALEKAVDSFNFLQDSETFAHRLSWYLRQATARYIVR